MTTTQNIPISSFPVAVALDGSEEVPIVQAGVTKRTTVRAIALPATEITLLINDTGSPITTGLKGYLLVPFECSISAWTLLGDQTGSIAIDVYCDPYANYGTNTSIVGTGTKPNISAGLKNTAIPFNWTTTTIPAGSVVGFSVTSVSSFQRMTIALTVASP